MSLFNPYDLIPENNHKAYDKLIQATKKFNPIIGYNPESNTYDISLPNRFSYKFAIWPQSEPIAHFILHNFEILLFFINRFFYIAHCISCN